MAFLDVRVRDDVIDIPFNLLALVFQIETARWVPKVNALLAELTRLHQEVSDIRANLEVIYDGICRCQCDVDRLIQDSTPLWDDTYHLCGDPDCDGNCRVCQEEESFLEVDATEKYCRRGRR